MAIKTYPEHSGVGSPAYLTDPATLVLQGLKDLQNGLLEPARTCLEQALETAPEMPDIHFAFGLLAEKTRDSGLARQHYLRAVKHDPRHAQARVNLGLLLSQTGALGQAEEQFRHAIDSEPTLPEGYVNLANLLQRTGRAGEAEATYRRALAIEPALPEAHRNLSSVLLWQNRLAEALQFALKAQQFDPDHAATQNTLGAIYKATQQTGKAVDCFRKAIVAEPGNAGYHANLAGALVDARRLNKAHGQYRRAIDLDGELPDAHHGLGMLQLLEGNFTDGWKNYEWRWGTTQQQQKRHQDKPEWDGKPATDRTVLVHCEQGLGDSIQFARYLTSVARHAGSVVLECPPETRRLFKSIPGLAKVVTSTDATPKYDIQVPLLSLPRLFGTTLDSIPSQVPYLRPPLNEPNAPDLPSGKLKVGLAWAGNPCHRNDAFRSMQWHDCQALLETDTVHFVSLQCNPGDAASAALGQTGHAVDAAPRCTDLAATAAIIAQLDIVIAVDTAVAHLAGALGKPIWLLLPFAAEWRWLHGRDNSPWYPTMRLFRQTRPGDWAGVIADVTAALRQQPTPAASGYMANAIKYQQQGQLEQAIDQFQLATKADPENTTLLRLLAGALREHGQTYNARTHLDRAIELEPNDAENHHELGLLLSSLGQAEAALGSYHRAIELQPGCADFQFNRGNAHYALGQVADARCDYERAAKLDPALASAHFNLGQIAEDEGDYLTSAQAYKHAVDLDANYTDAMVNLGLTLRNLNQTELAEECFWHILQRQPGQPMAGVNMAKLQLEREDPTAAEATCRSVLGHHPRHPKTLLNLGVALQAQNRVEEAIAVFNESIAVEPQNPDGPFNLAIAELAAGQWKDGWRHYEARWQTDNPLFTPRHHNIPRWSGEPLTGKTLLLFAEQGFGDTLQFCRYAPLLANTGARVVIECQPGLRTLLQTLPGVAEVFEPGEPVPPANLSLPMMSAPLVFGTLPETVPNGNDDRYLFAEASCVAPKCDAPNIGVIWAGRNRSWADNRSLPAGLLSVLIEECGHFAWFNLQLEPSNEGRDIIDSTDRITDLSPHISDFASTASLVESMDLIVTVDTSVAHLAGALGKPTWLLLPFAADWRWLLGRDDTPWYPNTRLFRQQTSGDWSELIGRVATELQRLAKG
ncbi:MAG: tetratricopeptide repeat protein [Verrucomicrobiota bacterium]|nr:tetratricopeptide repeat protein [Verrucomicrobiota bacterium]